MVIGGVVLLVAIAAALLFKGDGEGGGVNQAEIASFAKSIDHTKSATPSVPEERLRLGVSGKRAAPGK